MALTKVKVISGVVNGVTSGSEVEVDSNDVAWLKERGYVAEIEKAAQPSKPKAAPRKQSNKQDDKDDK